LNVYGYPLLSNDGISLIAITIGL